MNSIDQSLQNQLKNIQTRTNKTLDELYGIIAKSGLKKHGQIRDMLKKELGMGHGDANTLTTFYIKSTEEPKGDSEPEDALESIYVEAKANLRPIHEKLMSEIKKFGPFEISPKKTYVSLRLKKQFAMIGPATSSRIDVGINNKILEPTERLIAMPASSMCPFKVCLTSVDEVDSELLDWLKSSYDAALS